MTTSIVMRSIRHSITTLTGGFNVRENMGIANRLGREARAKGVELDANPFWGPDHNEVNARREWFDGWMGEHIARIREGL